MQVGGACHATPRARRIGGRPISWGACAIILEESRSTPGSGLGLSLVAAIAALHKTTVQLSDNSPGLRVRVLFAIQEV